MVSNSGALEISQSLGIKLSANIMLFSGARLNTHGWIAQTCPKTYRYYTLEMEKKFWNILLQNYAISVKLVIVLNFPEVHFDLFLNVLGNKFRGFYHLLSKYFFVWKHLFI